MQQYCNIGVLLIYWYNICTWTLEDLGALSIFKSKICRYCPVVFSHYSSGGFGIVPFDVFFITWPSSKHSRLLWTAAAPWELWTGMACLGFCPHANCHPSLNLHRWRRLTTTYKRKLMQPLLTCNYHLRPTIGTAFTTPLFTLLSLSNISSSSFHPGRHAGLTVCVNQPEGWEGGKYCGMLCVYVCKRGVYICGWKL